MEGPEGVILTLRDWTEATSELLSTQSSLEQLGPSEVLAIVDQLRTAIFNIGSLEAIDAASVAVGVLLEVTGDMSDNQDELLELIQGMLNGIIEPAEGGEFDEFDQLGLRVCQLVERSGQGDFAFRLLDGVAGHLLDLISHVEVAPEVRDGFLVAMHRLVSNCPPAVGERLGEEYASDLGGLVDLLYSADQFSQQVTLVQLLRRYSTLSCPKFINLTNRLNHRLTPRELRTDLVLHWFPGNSDVQQLFLEADVRTLLNIFNTSLPGDHVRVVSVEMVSMEVSDEIIGVSLVDFNIAPNRLELKPC